MSSCRDADSAKPAILTYSSGVDDLGPRLRHLTKPAQLDRKRFELDWSHAIRPAMLSAGRGCDLLSRLHLEICSLVGRDVDVLNNFAIQTVIHRYREPSRNEVRVKTVVARGTAGDRPALN